MKLKPTSPTSLAMLAGLALAVSAGATFFISDEPTSTDEPLSITVGRKHIYSEEMDAREDAAFKTVALNEVVPNLTLNDLQGQPHSLHDWHGRPVVFIFSDTVCPCVKSYQERVQKLGTEYSDAGLEVVYVFADATETPDQIQKFVEKQGVTELVLHDADQKLLQLLNAKCTTESFLLDAEGKLRYHGRIDDSIYKPEEVKERELQDAIQAVVAGRAVEKPETAAYGCAFVLKGESSVRPIDTDNLPAT